MGWAVKPPNAWFSAPAVGSKPIFFPKCWPIKELTRVWKLSLCARPGPQLWYFLFSHRAQGKLGSRLYALSKALIAFRFCTWIGPTEAQVLPCAPARNNVLIPSYRGAEDRGAEMLRASVLRTTLSIMPTLASVCSTGGRLQMVKISKRSVGKLKSNEH